MGKRTVSAVVVVIALALAAACSSGSSDSSDDAASARNESSAAQGAGGADSPADGAATSGEASFAVDVAGAPPAALGREIVSTATVTVLVDDIAAAREAAAATAEGAGGYVHSEQGQFGERPSATMTLKVLPERFRSVLASLGELGQVERQEVTTDDVTEQVIDLDSRIASTEASVARVRGFLDQATNVVEVASFESELLRRETDLEQLRGQKRSLDARIDLATVVLTVQPPPAGAVAAEPEELPAFAEGLRAGWSAFVAFGRVSLAVLGALIPFAPVLVLIAVGVWLVRRARRARWLSATLPSSQP
jgi:hypothetical protein